jgi:transaldolase
MPAGCRGAYHITALSGAKMIMSISVKIQGELLALKGPFETEIDKPVDEAVIRRLSTLAEFRKAYEEDGMQVEEFITYGSSNRTSTNSSMTGGILGKHEEAV